MTSVQDMREYLKHHGAWSLEANCPPKLRSKLWKAYISKEVAGE